MIRAIFLAVSVLCFSTFCEDAPVKPRCAFKIIVRHGKDQYSATAFFFSSTRLMTAAHTFKKADDGSVWIEKNGRRIHCKPIKIDFKKDIAVLECEEANESFYKIVGDIHVPGYPYGNDFTDPHGSLREEKGRTKANVFFVPGMSGAPVLDSSDNVIGMGTDRPNEFTENECEFIPVASLVVFLKDCK